MAAGLTLLVTLGSMLLSRMFLRPVTELVGGVSAVRRTSVADNAQPHERRRNEAAE
ncbi:MAG: hypothetical protein AAFQ35_02580 [Pseudomonadota bacterium]